MIWCMKNFRTSRRRSYSQVIRVDRGVVIVDLGRAEGFIFPQEQVKNEHYKERDRIKAYVLEVKKTPKGPQILLSRTHPGLLKRL